MSNKKYRVEYLNKAEFPAWDAFVDNSEFGTPFHNSDYLVQACNGLSAELKIVACRDNNDMIVAGYAFGTVKRFLVFDIVINPFSIVQNVITIKSETKYESKRTSIRNELVTLIVKKVLNDFKNATFIIRPEESDLRGYQQNSFKTVINYTYQAYLVASKDLFSNFNPEVKNKIRKAQKLQPRVRISDSESDIDIFLSLQDMTFERQRFQSQLNNTSLVKVLGALRKQGKLKIYTMLIKNIPVASRVEVIHNNMAYDIMAGANPDYIKEGVNQLLVYEVMKDLTAKKIKCFDFVGAGIESVSSFKSSFNFKLKQTYRIDIVKGVFLRFLFFLKEVLQ